MAKVKLAVAALLALVVLVLVVQNTEVVAVRLLLWEVSMSRVVLILLTTATGFACGWIVAKISGRQA